MAIHIAPIVFGALALRAAKALGIIVVTVAGLEVFVASVRTQIEDLFAPLPDQVLQTLGLMGVDLAINIMFSGVIARLSISALSRLGSRS